MKGTWYRKSMARFYGRRKKACKISNHEMFHDNGKLSLDCFVRTHLLLIGTFEGRISRANSKFGACAHACACEFCSLQCMSSLRFRSFNYTKQLIKDKFACPVLWRSPYFPLLSLLWHYVQRMYGCLPMKCDLAVSIFVTRSVTQAKKQLSNGQSVRNVASNCSRPEWMVYIVLLRDCCL